MIAIEIKLLRHSLSTGAANPVIIFVGSRPSIGLQKMLLVIVIFSSFPFSSGFQIFFPSFVEKFPACGIHGRMYDVFQPISRLSSNSRRTNLKLSVSSSDINTIEVAYLYSEKIVLPSEHILLSNLRLRIDCLNWFQLRKAVVKGPRTYNCRFPSYYLEWRSDIFCS